MPGYTVWINLERDIAFQLAFYSFHINPSRLDGDEEKINIYVRKMGGCVVGSHEPGCLHVVANMLPDQVSCSSSWHTDRPLIFMERLGAKIRGRRDIYYNNSGYYYYYHHQPDGMTCSGGSRIRGTTN